MAIGTHQDNLLTFIIAISLGVKSTWPLYTALLQKTDVNAASKTIDRAKAFEKMEEVCGGLLCPLLGLHCPILGSKWYYSLRIQSMGGSHKSSTKRPIHDSITNSMKAETICCQSYSKHSFGLHRSEIQQIWPHHSWQPDRSRIDPQALPTRNVLVSIWWALCTHSSSGHLNNFDKSAAELRSSKQSSHPNGSILHEVFLIRAHVYNQRHRSRIRNWISQITQVHVGPLERETICSDRTYIGSSSHRRMGWHAKAGQIGMCPL